MPRALHTPRAAAVAGIAFAVLLTTSLVLIRAATSADPDATLAWVADGDRIGGYEDKFFATVSLGSGLLFIAMLFASRT